MPMQAGGFPDLGTELLAPSAGWLACRQAVAQLVRSEKWADAVSMLLRFAASCDASGARNSQCKAYLGAVVVWLHAGKANDAWVTYQASGNYSWSRPADCATP